MIVVAPARPDGSNSGRSIVENQNGKARQLSACVVQRVGLKIDSNLARPSSGCLVIDFVNQLQHPKYDRHAD
eukprot:6211891-Pleurochrysis_carterae.AAC.1